MNYPFDDPVTRSTTSPPLPEQDKYKSMSNFQDDNIYRSTSSYQPQESFPSNLSSKALAPAMSFLSPSKYMSTFPQPTTSPVPIYNLNQLPCRPFSIESTYFLSQKNISEIKSALERCMEQLRVDKVFLEDLFAYECTCYSRQSEVNFRINLYENRENPRFSSPLASQQEQPARRFAGLNRGPNPDFSKGGYLIEMQRLCGDGFGFLDVFRETRSFLESQNIIAPTGQPPAPVKAFKPLPMMRVDPEVNIETINALLAMARSDFCDIQSEAMTVLADSTTSEPMQKALLSVKGLETILNLVKSPTPTVHRCAVATLANMITNQLEATRELRDLGIVAVLQARILNSTVLQVLRECSRALRTLALQMGQVSFAAEKLDPAAVQRLMESPDPIISENGRLIQEHCS